MKEATGELNMTVITIVAIGALVAFFYAVIWPTIKTSMALTSACNSAGSSAYKLENEDGSSINCGSGSCTYVDANGNSTQKDCGVNQGKK